jgi:hypothetical protein
VRHIWGDEAGKYRLYFWENLQARADAFGATIDLTTSPYAYNWIAKDLVKGALKGTRPDIELIQASSWENKYHSLHDEKAREFKRATMDERRFNMIYGGEFGQMIGLVYDSFDQDVNIVSPTQLPAGTKYYAGIDWGFTEPFVLVVRGVTPAGDHFQVSEYYKTGLTISDIIRVAKSKKETWNIQTFYCGKDQPGYIEEFNRAGLSAISADNDVRRGIDAHYELIRTRRYKIFRDTSPHTLDELETYHYPEPEDIAPDDKAKDQLPVQNNDHALDANRYVTMGTYRTVEKRAPIVHDESTKPKPVHDLNKFFNSLKKKKANAGVMY